MTVEVSSFSQSFSYIIFKTRVRSDVFSVSAVLPLPWKDEHRGLAP